MEQQSSTSQKGEIEFRKMLVQQQVEGQSHFQDEFDSAGIEKILGARMLETRAQMALLHSNGFALSPFVEIGAERGQRSLVLENDVGVSGAAVDLSYHMLKSCDHYRDVFHKSKMPLRVCCDANHLPFLSGSLPFVFCYETLHHFPDPAPVVREVYRVLAPGGCFLFNDEPFRKLLHASLYQREKAYSQELRKRGKLRKLVDFFLGDMNCNELNYGIVENHDLPMRAWRRALSGFEKKLIHLEPRLFSSVKRIEPGSNTSLRQAGGPGRLVKNLLAWLFGGVISGLCRKAGALRGQARSIMEALACPACVSIGRDSLLHGKPQGFFCKACGTQYPLIDGIAFLFRDDKFRELYPDLFAAVKGNQARAA